MQLSSSEKYSLNSNSKNNFYGLEEKIFEGVSSHPMFNKEMPYPFAVLEQKKGKVTLGTNDYVSRRVNDSIVLLMELEKIVKSSLGEAEISIELIKADEEFLSTRERINEKIESTEREKAALLGIEKQKNAGRCHLIPFPVSENKVRSDIIIERHALFAANTFKGDFRAHERKIKDPNTGEFVTIRVEIGDPTGQFKGAGVLKQKHQEAFYKLSQLWAMEHYQIEDEKEVVGSSLQGFIELSPYKLAQKLRGDSGGRTYKQALKLLREMSVIRINIKKINGSGKVCEFKDFALLSFEWSARNFDEKTLQTAPDGEAKVCIRFSDFITNNFLRKNIKSLKLDPYLSLKDRGRKGVAQLLYTMLDYELSTKDRFNISLSKLCDRLGLAQYGFKSKRKEKLGGSINAVNGIGILDGKYKIKCQLQESEDGQDWILVARKFLN